MIVDWNREDLRGQVFHFKNSLRPFMAVKNCAWENFFLDLNEGIFYTLYELLEVEGLRFYEKEDDEDFMGVDVVGRLEWDVG